MITSLLQPNIVNAPLLIYRHVALMLWSVFAVIYPYLMDGYCLSRSLGCLAIYKGKKRGERGILLENKLRESLQLESMRKCYDSHYWESSTVG